MNAKQIVSKMRQAGFVFNVTGDKLMISPADRLTQEQCEFIKAYKAAILTELAANDSAKESRRRKVISMLTEDPNVRHAYLVENPDSDPVILTMAIRNVATFDMTIPASKFDPALFLKFLDRVH